MAASDYFPAGQLGHVGHLLSDYLEGDLGDEQRGMVESHLKTCRHCARDLATLRFTIQVVHQLPLRPVPRGFAIPAAQRRPATIRTWLRWSTGALAAVFVALVAAQFLLPTTSPRASPSVARFAAPTSAPPGPRAAAVPPPAGPAASNPANGGATAASSSSAGAVAPPESDGVGPAPRPAAAVAPAPTTSPYPLPTGLPRVAGPTAAPSYPGASPRADQPTSASSAVYPGPGQIATRPVPPPTGGSYPAAQPTLPPPQAPTRSFTMTPAIVIVAALLALSGLALVLLGRRRE